MPQNYSSAYPKNIVRQSNFELLRIVATFLITMHHITINNINVCGYNHPYNYHNDGVVGLFINSLAIIGVNLFVLISGWFGIKRILPNIIRLIVDVAILGVVNIGIVFLLFDYDITKIDYIKTFSFMENWYVLHFIILILCSPFIELALKNCSFKLLTNSLIGLTIVIVYFGWYKGIINPTGYNYVNFIYLYIIGRHLNLYSKQNKIPQLKLIGLFLWPVIAFMQISIYLIFYKLGKPLDTFTFWSYNAPWVLLEAISVFYFFSQIQIKSNFINIVATGTLGIYILQSTRPFSSYRGILVNPFWETLGWFGVFIFAILLFCIFGIISIAYTSLYMFIEKKFYEKKGHLFCHSRQL